MKVWYYRICICSPHVAVLLESACLNALHFFWQPGHSQFTRVSANEFKRTLASKVVATYFDFCVR
jgi:hypothetical protein